MSLSSLLRDLALCFGLLGLACFLAVGLEAIGFVVEMATRGRDEEAE